MFINTKLLIQLLIQKYVIIPYKFSLSIVQIHKLERTIFLLK